jgi:two-component SAPR family response regulator
MDLAAILESNGAIVVGPCLSNAETLAMLDADAPDAALVDIRLGDGVSFAIACELAQRGIAFAFVTGCANRMDLPENLRCAPLISKPFDPGEIADFLRFTRKQIAIAAPDPDQASLG